MAVRAARSESHSCKNSEKPPSSLLYKYKYDSLVGWWPIHYFSWSPDYEVLRWLWVFAVTQWMILDKTDNSISRKTKNLNFWAENLLFEAWEHQKRAPLALSVWISSKTSATLKQRAGATVSYVKLFRVRVKLSSTKGSTNKTVFRNNSLIRGGVVFLNFMWNFGGHCFWP